MYHVQYSVQYKEFVFMYVLVSRNIQYYCTVRTYVQNCLINSPYLYDYVRVHVPCSIDRQTLLVLRFDWLIIRKVNTCKVYVCSTVVLQYCAYSTHKTAVVYVYVQYSACVQYTDTYSSQFSDPLYLFVIASLLFHGFTTREEEISDLNSMGKTKVLLNKRVGGDSFRLHRK